MNDIEAIYCFDVNQNETNGDQDTNSTESVGVVAEVYADESGRAVCPVQVDAESRVPTNSAALQTQLTPGVLRSDHIQPQEFNHLVIPSASIKTLSDSMTSKSIGL